MEKDNYRQIEEFESTNWWYRGRRDLLSRILSTYGNRFESAIDVGCGVGANVAALKAHAETVTGLDLNADAISFARAKGYDQLIHGSIVSYTPVDKYDLVVCMDVLEHVDDQAAIANIGRMLRAGGLLILSVPAHEYLWGDNDVFSHHLRRYEPSQVRELIAGTFDICRLTYWNCVLFVPTYVLNHVIRRNRISPTHELKNNLLSIPTWLNPLFYALIKCENVLLTWINFWQGTSLVAVAERR